MENDPIIDDKAELDKFKFDTFNERLKKREIWVNTGITSSLVEILYTNLIKLQEESTHLPIKVIINSTGGYLYESVVATDIMGTLSCPVTTIALANAVSGGFIIFMGGNERICHDYTNLMMHAVGMRVMDKTPDISEQVEHVKYTQAKMAKFFAYQTGGKTTPEYWTELFDSGKDKWFTIEEAIKLGIVNKVIKRHSMIDPTFVARPPHTWDIIDIGRSQL